MNKEMFLILFLIIFVNLSCENKASFQSINTVLPKLSPTSIPKEDRDKEFLKHYQEGLKITVESDSPENQLKAIEEFKKAAEIKPEDIETYRRISETYISMDKYGEAAIYLRKITELNPDDGYAQLGLAEILIEHLNKFEEGLKFAVIAEKLYESGSTKVAIARLKGKAYDGMGDYKNAIQQYKIFLKTYNSPDAADHIETKKRISELEKLIQNSNKN